MATYDEQLNAIRAARAERDQARDQLHEQLIKQLKLSRAQRRGDGDQSHELERGRSLIADQKGILIEKEKAVGIVLDNLFLDLTPQTLIEQWNDAFPIMLLPLRLETRFKTVDNAEQLWVRVYPDEIFVTTHEKILTDRENEYAQAYWKLLAGATDEQPKKDAWRELADKFGPHRAAWVALQTKPNNWTTPPPSADALQFPVIELTKPDNWTEAPHTLMLPDRFVLMAFRGGNLVHTQVGKQIKDRVILGPAPLEDENKPSITRDPADNR